MLWSIDARTLFLKIIRATYSNRKHVAAYSTVFIEGTGDEQRLNMELDLQSFFLGSMCTAEPKPPSPPPPILPQLGSYTRALLVSQERRHLSVAPGGYCRASLTNR